MDYSIEVAAKEFDERSSQFACELTISNNGTAAFEVIAARPRIPKGLRLNEANDASELRLIDRHAALCDQLQELVGAFLVTHSKDEATAYAQRMVEAINEAFSVRKVFGMNVAVLLGQRERIYREMRTRLMRLPITNSGEGERALKILRENSPTPIEIQTAEFVLQSVKDIEQNRGFEASRDSRSLVQPGQQLKSVYVLQARRGVLGIKSYCINFNIGLRSEDGLTHASRLASTSLSVSPNPVSLTVLAVAASAAGAAIRHLVNMPAGTPTRDLLNQGPSFLVAALTALIIFNIFELTRLREQLRTRVSWRGAILVGFLCGYLNDRILSAVEALLGS